MKLNPIKKIYAFLLMFEIICCFIMLLELIESNFNLEVPIYLSISENFYFSGSFNLNWLSLMGFTVIVAIFYVISGINVAATGPNDSSSHSIKKIIGFLVILLLMVNSVNFVLLKSSLLKSFLTLIDIVIILFHMLNFVKEADSEE